MIKRIPDRYSTHIKLYSLIVVTSFVILALGIYGTLQLHTMERNTKVIFYDEVLSLDYLTSMRYGYIDGIQNTIRAFDDDRITLDSAKRLLLSEQVRIDSNWQAYKATYLTPPEVELIRASEPLIRHTDTVLVKLVASGLAVDDTSDIKEMNVSIAALMPNLQSLVKLQVKVSSEFYENNQSLYKTTSKTFMVLALGVLVFMIAVSSFIVRDTSQLIFRLEESNRVIAESEEKYRYLFDSTPAFIIIWDMETRMLLEINEMVKKARGYTDDEWRKMSVLDLVPEKDRPAIAGIMENLRNMEIPLHNGSIYKFVGENGKVRYMNISGHPIVYQGRKARLTLIEDLSEIYLAEESIQKMNEQIKGLYTHLQTAREDERAYLAREIHDEFGQYLTVLKMDISWIEKNLPAVTPAVRDRFARIYEHIDLTVRNTRRMITDLRPPLLDDAGILATIEWHLAGIQAATDISCSLSAPQTDIQIGRAEAVIIYRIYQEATTNILKHAHATAIEVAVGLTDGIFAMSIRDDGIGFDPEATPAGSGYGILGMRERAASVGGRITIDSASGSGTTIVVQIPVTGPDVT